MLSDCGLDRFVVVEPGLIRLPNQSTPGLLALLVSDEFLYSGISKMSDSRAKYHPLPSSEDQTYHSDIHEAGDDGDNNLDSMSKCVSAEAQAGWTYFFLGCATLLPWNGDASCQMSCIGAHNRT